MTNTDIEEFATNKIKEQVLKNNDCLRPFINDNDKTPLWDGTIFIYNDSKKTNSDFEGKIDVQVKGRNVENFKDKNTYQIDIVTIKGYQKEVKGTLLFVVDFITFDKYKIYYCNLLPVDLFEILRNLKEDQKTISLQLKEIKNDSVLNFKNVCLNFYKNSCKQAGKRIIDETEFNNIEELNFEIIANKDEYEQYLEKADIYTYAKMKKTHEEVATVKGKWTPFSVIKKDITIDGLKYYSEFTITGVDNNELSVGPLKINLKECNIHVEFKGDLKERIKGLMFLIKLFEYKYFKIDDAIFEFPFSDLNKIEKNKIIYTNQLNYFKKIQEIFKFFKTDFDIDFDNLNEKDLENLKNLINLYNGNFSDEIKDMQKYFVKINKYKFIFVTVRGKKNRFFNFYSQEILDNLYCFFDVAGKKIRTSIYSNIVPEEFINISNFDSKIILRSFKKIELNENTMDSINLMALSFIKGYDLTQERMYLNLADKLNQINCKNRISDIDLINSKQIKYRKKGLSINDKKLLKNVSEKDEYKEDYMILCSIDLLLSNNYSFLEHFKLMSKKEKEIFKEYPIYNLNTLNNNFNR